MSTPLDEADQFLMGGGGPPSAFNKFDGPGTRRGGEILKRQKTQQTKFGTGELLFFDEAKTQPREQLEITVQTTERDPSNDGDTGKRRFFLRGNTDLFEKTQAAVKAAKAPGIQVGGQLWVTRVRQESRTGKNGNWDEWLHEVTYIPAKPGEDTFLMGDSAAPSNGNGHAAPSMPPQTPEAVTPTSAPIPPPSAPPASAPIPASPQNGDGASGLDWSKLGHLPMDVRVQLASIPGLTTDVVLLMHPAPASAPAAPAFGGLSRAEFPNVDDRQWAAIKEAVEQKGASVAAMKAAFAV